jgi:hypothetical protein
MGSKAHQVLASFVLLARAGIISGKRHSSKSYRTKTRTTYVHKIVEKHGCEISYNTIFTIYLLQPLYIILSSIGASAIHNNGFKLGISTLEGYSIS